MKTFRLGIVASLAVNILLAGYWLKSKRPPALAETISATGATPAPHASGDAEEASTSTAGARPPASTWFDLQSADLKEFVRRLRAAGCPDETIKDIILAEVNRRFALRQREIWPEQFNDFKYWQVERRHDLERARKQREQSRKQAELQKEKSALLVELLGVDPERQQRLEEGYEDFTNWQERQVAFLPESKREAALQIIQDFQERQQEMYAVNRGLWDSQSRAEQRQLEADRLTALAAVLSPEELREFELRESQLASQLSHDLRNVSITRSEYETLFDLRKKYGDSIYNYGDIETAEARQQVEANKKALNEELTAALGADKLKEYERSQDYQYQQLQRIAKKNELPADTAGKVYDYKSIAEDGAKALRNNKDLPAEQRQAALAELRTETENTLKQTLGEKGYKSYLKNGGWWINNIAPQKSPAPKQ